MLLNYGKTAVEINFETRNFDILDSSLPAPSIDARQMVEVALANATPPLSQVLANAKTVCVLIPDSTRYAASEIYLPILLSKIKECEPLIEIIIIIANGLHKTPDKLEIKELIGKEIAQNYNITFNESESAERYVKIGEFPDGEPVEVLREIAEADKIIITGAVSLHYLAGFGGGRKIIVPGSASRRTILAAHKLSLHPTPGMGRNPACKPGNLDNNEMHERLMSAVRILKPAFMLNTLISPDKALLEVFAGEPEATFQNAVIKTKSAYIPQVKTADYDFVIASAGGFPKDIDLIQAHKALEYASKVAKDGATIILLAECRQGVGHKDFLGWFKHGSSFNMDIALRNDFAVYRQTATTMREKCERFKVYLFTHLQQEIVSTIGAEKLDTILQIERMVQSLPFHAKIAAIPHSGTFCFEVIH